MALHPRTHTLIRITASPKDEVILWHIEGFPGYYPTQEVARTVARDLYKGMCCDADIEQRLIPCLFRRAV